MSLRVVAVVISNDQPNFLTNSLNSIERQSFTCERILVVDTSSETEVEPVLQDFISRSSRHAVVKVEEKANFAELAALGIKQALVGIDNLENVAIWLVHDDCVAEVHALAELVRTLELSPLVGLASPKQLAVENPKIIVQQGLSLSASLRPFSLVNDELDQKQHDGMSDVLAVSTNAMLVRANLWADLGGFSVHAPEYAQDIEFGIRAHQLGFRVVVVPTARVRHGELSINNKRSRKWLGGSAKSAVAKATNHLRLSQWPALLALGYWLALPVISIVQIFWLLLVKRPDRIGFTLRANLWAFFTVRARLKDRKPGSIRSLRPLFVSRQMLRARSRLALEIQEQRVNLEGYETQRVASQVSFAAGGGLWLMLLLGVLSYQFFPFGQAAVGGYALPLSDSWLELFANTASSYQHIGLGLAAPSDPFNWVLLAIGSLTFFAPNLAFSWLLILAKPLAFFGAWRLLSTITPRNSVRLILAAAYVFWPAFTQAQNEANFPSVIFAVVLPWLIFCLARFAKVGISATVRSSAQGWSWLAISALLFAVCLVSSPSSIALLTITYLVFIFLLGKRFILGLFVLLPAIVASGPYFAYQLFSNQNALFVLADPTLALPNQQQSLLTAVFGLDPIFSWFAVALVGFATLTLISRSRKIVGLWLVVLLTLGNTWLISSLAFPGGGFASINYDLVAEVYLSTNASSMFLILVILSIIAFWLESLTRANFRRLSLGLVAAGALAPLMVGSLLTPSNLRFTDSRNLPAIFTAEAKAGSQLRMLIITGTAEQSFRAELVQAGGLKLDALSTAYRLSPVNLSSEYPGKEQLAKLVANLVSANGKRLNLDLQNAGVGFILVPASSSNGDIQVALNTSAELDQVGTTEYGQLWRVINPKEINTDPSQGYWSITKTIQLAVIFGYILLALPTSRGRKKRISNQLIEEEVE